MGRCSPLGRHGCRRLPHVVLGLSSPLGQHGCRQLAHVVVGLSSPLGQHGCRGLPDVVRCLGVSVDLHYGAGFGSGFGLLVDLVHSFDPGMTFLGIVDFLD